jgi:hypothetical protein
VLADEDEALYDVMWWTMSKNMPQHKHGFGSTALCARLEGCQLGHVLTTDRNAHGRGSTQAGTDALVNLEPAAAHSSSDHSKLSKHNSQPTVFD